ncbi:MAG: DsrE family protein, partial [Sulfurimonadaceae bacterium]|nr:DsrE family protein [Sulfurimonadaceae bacterium]
IVSNDALFFYTEKESEVIKNIHKQLKKLSLSYNVEIRACEIALKHFNIDKSDLLQEIKTTKNSFMDVIQLQNKGYAFFPLID